MSRDLNPSHFSSILARRASRRSVLRGAAVATTAAALPLGLTGCGDHDVAAESDGLSGALGGSRDPDRRDAPLKLGFTAVAKGLHDYVRVPTGYRAQVLTALGDPIHAGTAPYANDGTQHDFASRIGDHGDALAYFPFPKHTASAGLGLLVQNHEALTDVYLHAAGPTHSPILDKTATEKRPLAEVAKEQEAHGVSLVKIARDGAGKWKVLRDYPGNARWHVNTPMTLSGPARGSAQLVTKLSPGADVAHGTLNNCGNGKTPWHTYLTAEENWNTYFTRGDDAALDAARDARLKRYGIAANNVDPVAKTAPSNYRGWDRADGGGDLQARFDCTAKGAAARDDFRNEPNHFGWVVEIDPYRAERIAKKRTALGRFAHEGAWFGPVTAGEPLVVYMGDDSRNEYVYKYVSDKPWDPADAGRGHEAGDAYLDHGTLYVARFLDDGTGAWLKLSTDNPALARFADLADILVNARVAADAVGATKMDRPEWGAVHPRTGEFYLTLTNNSLRGTTGPAVDGANPRSYEDGKGETKQTGNVNGHIVRLREDGDAQAATAFRWDVYVFGAQADADPRTVNLSGLTDANDFSSPDGLFFDGRGVLWIETDDGAYTDVTNCMLLAALPGRVGDGGARTVGATTTQIGAAPTADTLRRFLVGVPGSEITGIDMTPDHTSLFVSVQHPGEAGDLTTLQSTWPSRTTDDAGVPGAAGNRPRTATIVITREDGGEIGT
ncbi:MAG: PhoX family phosphatase [Polyangiales bacterium]